MVYLIQLEVKNLGLESDMTKYESPSDLRGDGEPFVGLFSKVFMCKESAHISVPFPYRLDGNIWFETVIGSRY
mgnify:CR=1 FL=1